MSSAPSWFGPLSSALIARADPADQLAMQAAHDLLATRLADAPSSAADAIRNQFSAGTLQSIMGALPTDSLALVPGLSGIVGSAADALMGELDQVLAPLQEAADQLREVADIAWSVARAPANAAAALLKAENIAAIAAAATGLPPVDAAWAGAAQVRNVEKIASEVAAKAAMAADSAWGAIVKTLDTIREQVFDAIGSVADAAQGAMDSIASMSGRPISAVAQDLSGELASAVDAVLPA